MHAEVHSSFRLVWTVNKSRSVLVNNNNNFYSNSKERERERKKEEKKGWGGEGIRKDIVRYAEYVSYISLLLWMGCVPKRRSFVLFRLSL